MAKDKDIESDDITVEDRNAGPENDKDAFETESDDAGIQTRTLIYLAGQVKPGEPLVDKVETTSVEDGLVETTEIRLKSATGCPHVIHTASEAGEVCLSCRRLSQQPLLLCAECARNTDNTCYVCHAVCCWRCRDQRWLDGDMRVVCRACIRTTLRIRLLKQILKWLVISAGLLYLIAF